MNKSKKVIKKKINIEDVRSDLLSRDSLDNMYAIRYCVLNNITDETTINIIKKLKNSDLIEANSVKISDCAKAALDLLGIEKHKGNDEVIIDYIDTVFLTKI